MMESLFNGYCFEPPEHNTNSKEKLREAGDDCSATIYVDMDIYAIKLEREL